jgi:PAN domain
MKACPTCKRTYEDELTFCLVDGSILSAPYDPNQTVSLPPARSTDPAPTEIFNPAQSVPETKPHAIETIQSNQPPPLYAAKRQARAEEKLRGKSWMLIGIGMSLVIVFVLGVILSFIWFGKDSGADEPPQAKLPNINSQPTPTPTQTTPSPSPTPSLSPSPSPSPSTLPSPSPTATVEIGIWGKRNDRASMNGTNLTYYPVTTPGQCKADCEKNQRCKGYTFIRAGAYNPGDSAMCYLMAVVTEMVPHACCISEVKR